ncbi:polysaccharide deacetylase family protein [Marinobacter zhejiangensis]|uniref:Peptidoglycan/xylan/chitin deacetylase, PgdA/CDA1 family n=1 Tax=Marinobacter zhejiangensis TaxID=488535 RepID=A0A1I4RNC0_9GAMM|nr:polysaccharide deacetylase family protein [Marinobacter zhejiangensis]SFM53480.1 Peptidoglycan/xylan/chitin deacetylase, PgdA/CDA1 family [Marinobacter zhejiangensis]
MAFKTLALKFANFLGETGVYHALFPRCIPVFMLHRFTESAKDAPGTLSADLLRRYLQYLASHGYQVLTMDDLGNILLRGDPVPPRAVMFTVDDGFYDHHDVVAKVFDEFGFPLNFFVITGFLDGKLWPWDDQVVYALNQITKAKLEISLPSGRSFPIDLKEFTLRDVIREFRKELKRDDQALIYEWIKNELFPALDVEFPPGIPDPYRPMTWSDAQSLRHRGHGVYPHTCTHRILSVLPESERRFEILESQKRAKTELDYFPDVFAYPTGRLSDYDVCDVMVLKQAGFRMAFNTVAGYVKAGAMQDVYSIPRFSLPEKFGDFQQIVNRFEAVKESLKREQT